MALAQYPSTEIATKHGFTEVKTINGWQYRRGDIMVMIDGERAHAWDIFEVKSEFEYKRLTVHGSRPRKFEAALIRAAALEFALIAYGEKK